MNEPGANLLRQIDALIAGAKEASLEGDNTAVIALTVAAAQRIQLHKALYPPPPKHDPPAEA